MVYYMEIFNFFIVFPQLVTTTILGFMVNGFVNNEPVYAFVVDEFSMILAGILTLKSKN